MVGENVVFAFCVGEEVKFSLEGKVVLRVF